MDGQHSRRGQAVRDVARLPAKGLEVHSGATQPASLRALAQGGNCNSARHAKCTVYESDKSRTRSLKRSRPLALEGGMSPQ